MHYIIPSAYMWRFLLEKEELKGKIFVHKYSLNKKEASHNENKPGILSILRKFFFFFFFLFDRTF